MPLVAGDEKKLRRCHYRKSSGASSAAVPITDNLNRIICKIAACLPFVSCAEALSPQTVGEDFCFWPPRNFGQKIGPNLSEDLFVFGLPLILGKKSD